MERGRGNEGNVWERKNEGGSERERERQIPSAAEDFPSDGRELRVKTWIYFDLIPYNNTGAIAHQIDT